MNFKKSLLMATMALGSASSVNALDLNDFTQIKEGLYASLDENGKLTEVATNNETIFEMKMDKNDDLSQSVRKLMENKSLQSKEGTATLRACGYPLFQIEELSTSGDTLSLTATGHVTELAGPVPPSPDFLLVRTKAKFKGFDTNGNFVLKSMAVDRDVVESNFSSTKASSQNMLQATYGYASTTAEINTSQLSRVYWVGRTDLVVDNPSDNQNNYPASANGDCYQTLSIKVSNNIYY